MHIRWSLSASPSVRTLAGARVQTRAHARWPIRADTCTHSCTRAAKSSEASSAGTKRRCCARTDLSPPRNVYPHTHLRTPVQSRQTHPRGGEMGSYLRSHSSGNRNVTPRKAPEGLWPGLRWARVCRNPEAGQPAASSVPKMTLEGPQQCLGVGKKGRRHHGAAQRPRLGQGVGAALIAQKLPTLHPRGGPAPSMRRSSRLPQSPLYVTPTEAGSPPWRDSRFALPLDPPTSPA